MVEHIASRLMEETVRKIQSEQIVKRNLIWLELNGCSGNIISLLDGTDPDIEYMMREMVNLIYDQSLLAAEGEKAMDQLFDMVDQDFILAVEGAVSTKDNGIYQVVGNWRGTRITGFNAIKLLGEKASHVIAVGACASHGGVSAAKPNPSACVGVQDILNREVIRLPGCPCHPEWFLGTLANILLYGEPALDEENRPILFYGTTIHQRCERRSFFDQGIFASKLGESTCMFRVGCRGPVTRIDCPIRKWNDAVSWPVQCNTPCIGCANLRFPDGMEPFITYPPPEEINEGGAANE